METNQINPTVTWDRSAEMQDLKAVPMYFLRPGETRHIVIRNVDLAKVLAAFPIGGTGNLWPWFVRLNIHVQDRNGRQIASAEQIVRLWPDSARKKEQHLKATSVKTSKS